MEARVAAKRILTLLVVGGLAARATQIYYSGSKEAARAAGPGVVEVDPSSTVMDALRFFPEVDEFLPTFMASTDQAIASWEAEGNELPIERRDLFLQVLYDFRAICTIESGGDPLAISPDEKHLGICQLDRDASFFVAEGEDDEILFDPHYNIYRGEWYYFVLWMKAYDRLGGGDLEKVSRYAAAGYYIGGVNVDGNEANWDGETKEYVRRFLIAREKVVYP